MLGLGPPEILLIMVLALLLFGPKRLPEMGKAVGKAIREFKKATSDVEEQIKKEVEGLEETVSPIKDTVEQVKKVTKTPQGT